MKTLENYTAFIQVDFGEYGTLNTNYVGSAGSITSLGYVMEGVFTKICNGIGNFKIKIADPSWSRVEKTVLDSKGVCTISYGYLEDSEIRSPAYKARIFNYDLEYDMGRTIVSITGLLLGYELTTNTDLILTKADNDIAKVLKKISAQYGMSDGLIEAPTTPKDFNGLLSSKEEYIKIGCADGETPLQLITQKLTTYALNSNKKGGYVFYTSTRDSNGNKQIDEKTKLPKVFLNFCTPEYKEKNQPKQLQKTYYIFGQTPNPHVLDYKPSWNATLVDITGGADIVNSLFNKTTGEILQQKESDVQYVESEEQAKYKLTAAQPGPQEAAEAAAINMRSYALMAPLTAELLLMGDPDIEVLDVITVIVYIPTTEHTKGSYAGKIHKMSGMYMAKQVVDTISMGKYTTQVSLMISPTLYAASKNSKEPAKVYFLPNQPTASSNNYNVAIQKNTDFLKYKYTSE